MPSPYLEQLKNCRRIGLFDSGVGGLTVLDKLIRLSSSEPANGSISPSQLQEFVYLADTARCPYGNRPSSDIETFIVEIMNWLVAKNVDGIVVACNTSASVALEATRHLCPVPIFDLIVPTAQYVASLGRRVGVMATTATVRAQAFAKAIHAVDPEIEVVEIACPDLVPVIERGEIRTDSTLALLKKYAQTLSKEKVEVLIWGCTHFPFLSEPFETLLERKLILVDPAQVLVGHSELREIEVGQPEFKHAVYVTGDPFEFARTASICLGYSLDTVNGITTEELIGAAANAKAQPKKAESTDNIQIAPAV